MALRAAERKTQQAAEFGALLVHEGNLPPGGLALLSEDEIIALGSQPYAPGPIEIADPMHAGRPPGANDRTIADNADDVAANLLAAGWTKDES